MTAVLYELPVSDLGRIMREAELRVKDKSYRATEIGQDVGRYLRAFRWSGNQPSSIDQYERVLARFALWASDQTLEEYASPLGSEYALSFLDHFWGDCARDTQAQKLSILKAFFKWATGEGRMAYNPIGHVKAPRQKRTDRQAYPRNIIVRLVTAQESLRDQCCLQLLGRRGLRKDELRRLQIKDVDLARDLLTIHGKGGHVDVEPIELKGLSQDLYLHIQGDNRRPAEYLLYPKNNRLKMMDPSGVHGWFKRCLKRAGLPESIKIHEMRHTAGDDVWRTTGNLIAAQEFLRHSSPETTRRYVHPNHSDLRAAIRAVEDDWGKA